MILGACAASEDSKATAPAGEVPSANLPVTAPAPAPEVAPEAPPEVATVAATASIASVQLNQDCPDARAQSKASPKNKSSASMAFAPSMLEPGPGGSAKGMSQPRSRNKKSRRRPPCTQSTLQLAFTGQQGESSVATVKAVRLKSADGKDLGALATRMPTVWKDAGYEPWDGTIEPGTDLKTSYKISVPDWSAVEKTLGGRSYGKMYTVEVDVEIRGEVTTVTSAEFKREATLKSPEFERVMPQNVRT